MILNYKKEADRQKGNERHKYLIENEKKVDYTALNETRTSRQNRAIRKFFILMAEGLNERGLEYEGVDIFGEVYATRYNKDITREFIWRPIQKALFCTNSTTELNTYQINEIADVIIKHFGESEIKLVFPSIKWLIDNE